MKGRHLPKHLKPVFAAVCVLAVPVQMTCAAPFQPADNAQILERMPATISAETREIRDMRRQLEADPKQTALALSLAKRYIARGKAEADPRYYGYAEGVLQSLLQLPKPPIETLLLGALIKQHRHDFANALADLDKLLQRRPDNAQAWLTRATILLVQARYSDAQQSCAPLIEIGDILPAATCLAQVNSQLGHAQKSYDFLLDELSSQPTADAEQRQWALTVLADIALRLNKEEDADRHFAAAVDIEQPNVYLYGAYADFLLDRQQPQRVLTLLQDKSRIDSLLLRIALAKQQMAASDTDKVVAELKARFAASRQRGENLHQGDEARFALHLLHEPQQALQLAQANWQAQREPKDDRILLEAALAAEDAAAAKPVLDLLATTHMEHPRLQALAAQISNLQ